MCKRQFFVLVCSFLLMVLSDAASLKNAEVDDLYDQQTALFETELNEEVDPAAPVKRNQAPINKNNKNTAQLVQAKVATKSAASSRRRGGSGSASAGGSGRRRYSGSGRRRSTYSSGRRRYSGYSGSGRRRSTYSSGRRRYGYSSGRRRRHYYSSSSSGACFPSTATVHTKRQGKISIDKLAVGDKVMTHHGYAEVLFFAVRKPKTVAKFLKITTSNSTLVLTSSHGVFKKDGTPLLASKVNVGDELLTAGKVLSIVNKNGVGLVAPITTSGALVVDGVTTSDYGPLAHRYGQGVAHAAMSPLRILSWMFPKWSVWHKHQEDGHHPFKTWGTWLLQL